ncbi:MAG TPA: phosphoribosylanthranilate isomerase [Acidobacteriota bacterium]|nr:phosphoribosylanthranilate isomerase [Acidobacteriota bacterium]HND20428.1 phosphoribosylanthranilate isomerase [Acidobacteriota bacterium]HNH84905.1 phosphoribosylanthranilate isomerase [Acidobacteriota bacterium]HNJ40499.1 phosphoribosylanthranilate isomerase [Acidobacteriota bacterium]
MVKVKICGITSYQDAALALDYGADALGFIFNHKSPSYIAPSSAREIVEKLPPFVPLVGVFHNEFNLEAVTTIAQTAKVSILQLHGNESPGYCQQFSQWRLIKTMRVGESFDFSDIRRFPVSAVLLEGYSEDNTTGKLFDWRIAAAAKQYARIILSGGLTPENVAAALRTVKPYGVDVSSGVEDSATPGRKDRMKIQMFMAEVERGRMEILKSSTGRLPSLTGYS